MNFNEAKSVVVPVLLILVSLSYLGKRILTKTATTQRQTTSTLRPINSPPRNPSTVQNKVYPQPPKSKLKKPIIQSKLMQRKIPARTFTSTQKPIYKITFQPVQAPEHLQELAFEQQQIEKQRINDEIEYRKQQERNFLSNAVGLHENQIDAVRQQNENYNQEIQSISATQQNTEQARTMITEAGNRHHKWMIQHLGVEVHNQIRNLSAR